MSMGLKKDESLVIDSLEKFVNGLMSNKEASVRTIFLKSKQYICFMCMLEKKKRKDMDYEHLEIQVDLCGYRGFEVKRAGL